MREPLRSPLIMEKETEGMLGRSEEEKVERSVGTQYQQYVWKK